jgi:riboflavin kinase / FMN adenylyltransferase
MIACALGKFDALHIGHRALIDKAAELGDPYVVTFSGMAAELGWEERLPLIAPADRAVIFSQWEKRLGKPLRERVIPFAQVRAMDAATFVGFLWKEINAQAIVVGENFRFAKNRQGDTTQLTQLMRERGGNAIIVPAICAQDIAVSSSRVRTALACGELNNVRLLLGRDYTLHGTVTRGDGRGKTIGFPTANIAQLTNQPPGFGVYAAWATFSTPSGTQRFPAAVNIGQLPTISAQRSASIEAHILSWHGDLYGQAIALTFIERLRGEIKFPSLTALTEQITRDCAQVAAICRDE